jgi:hypothetical protein
LLPAACTSLSSTVTSTEAFDALRLALRIPLDGLRTVGSASVAFHVPRTRVSLEWGDPIYVVFWRTERRSGRPLIHDFSDLRTEVQVTVDGQSIQLVSSRIGVYLHSSETENVGLSFVANPGAEVRVDIRALEPTSVPAEGEFVVAPMWVGVKDRLVRAMLDDQLRTVIRALTMAGLACLAVGAMGGLVARRLA